MAKRYEFSKKVRREALKRAGNGDAGAALCEAVGERYGLTKGTRCNAPLNRGVEFDHYPVQATEKGSDTLENCVAVCPTCHRFKTSTYDVPVQAKSKRMRDKALGIHKPKSRPLRSRNSFKWQPPNVKDINEDLDA